MDVPASVLFWLKTGVILAFCIGLSISPALWIGPRSYPLAPVSSMLPAIDRAVTLGLYFALFVIAAIALVVSRPRWFIAGFLAVIAVFCLADQTRWQPWVFQYSCLLAAAALYSWNAADVEGARRTLNIARLIVASTYVFSGLQKINPNFVENDFPWIVQPITSPFPSATDFLHVFGMAVLFVQVAFGIGLLTRRYRCVSLILAIAMHLFILAMFGPAGLNWNDIVWPWTAAMAVFDLMLFSGTPEFSWREVVLSQTGSLSCGRGCFVRDAAGAKLLQSVGFVSVLGALFRQSNRGANLYDGCRKGFLARGDQVASGSHVTRHQRLESSTLGD